MKLYVALILSVLVSCIAAWVIAARYRTRMKELMRAPRAGLPAVSVVDAVEDAPPADRVSLADNRAAGMRLGALLVVVSLLISASSAWLWSTLSFPEDPLRPKQIAVLALLHSWPVVPALALMWRWSRLRLFGTLLLWCAVTFCIFLWRQVELNPTQALLALVLEMGLPLVLVSLVFLGNAARAVAPWLVVPVAALMWASLASIDLLMYFFARESPWLLSILHWLSGFFGTNVVWVAMAIAAILPWIILWWPARLFGRALGRAYFRKWFSDLLVVFTGVWALSLADRAVTTAMQAGTAALALFLPLLWIPVATWLMSLRRARLTRPPTLLVLRVFQQDKQAQKLFDQVVERWRLSGNTLTIAGTDLADRTLGADDVFLFLDGKLTERFVAEPVDIARRIATFDMRPDIDGRYRVNECYCHDTTWKEALQALVRRSDVALMDLRGFQARNAGCAYELGVLAQGSRALRVVLLVDGRTDRKEAEKVVATRKSERFVWLEADKMNAVKFRETLGALFS